LPDGIAPGEPVVLVVRPEDIQLITAASDRQENVLRARVEAVIFMGDALECQLSVGSQRLRVKLHPSTSVRQGDTVCLRLLPERCRALRGS